MRCPNCHKEAFIIPFISSKVKSDVIKCSKCGIYYQYDLRSIIILYLLIMMALIALLAHFQVSAERVLFAVSLTSVISLLGICPSICKKRVYFNTNLLEGIKAASQQLNYNSCELRRQFISQWQKEVVQTA